MAKTRPPYAPEFVDRWLSWSAPAAIRMTLRESSNQSDRC
jgi:hypothetical protein